MTKHVSAEVFPSDVVVPTHGHPSVQTVAIEVRTPGLASPREPCIQVHVVGLHVAMLVHTPELAKTKTQLGAADDRFVLGFVSRVVGVTQHASSLEFSKHARLHATGHLRDLALGRSFIAGGAQLQDDGKGIRQLRLEAGLTIEALAYESDVKSKGHLSSIERGLVMPTVATLKALADRLGVHLLDLVTVPDEDLRQRLVDLTRRWKPGTIRKLIRDFDV